MTDIRIPATGNAMKPNHSTFMTISGGPSGNLDTEEPEVHVMIEPCCGGSAQSWFFAADLVNAIAEANGESDDD